MLNRYHISTSKDHLDANGYWKVIFSLIGNIISYKVATFITNMVWQGYKTRYGVDQLYREYHCILDSLPEHYCMLEGFSERWTVFLYTTIYWTGFLYIIIYGRVIWTLLHDVGYWQENVIVILFLIGDILRHEALISNAN